MGLFLYAGLQACMSSCKTSGAFLEALASLRRKSLYGQEQVGKEVTFPKSLEAKTPQP